MTNRNLSNLKKRLEKMELEHLRTYIIELQEKLDEAEYAARNAEFWQMHAMDLQESLHDDQFATHRAVGISKSGELMVVALDSSRGAHGQ